MINPSWIAQHLAIGLLVGLAYLIFGLTWPFYTAVGIWALLLWLSR